MISIIVAIADNRVIGDKNKLPWYLPADLKHFSTVTKPHTVIMGRKTYESIVARLGKPLPDRTNIIVTRHMDFNAPGCIVVNSVEDALTQPGENKFIIGGEEIYKLFLPYTERLLITHVHANIPGDTKFPDYNKSEWVEVSREDHLKDEKNQHDYSFTVYERKK
ncbi:MAG: dihydrofolate reductase [Candidatus Zambryskibacteria bacterium RIFCSPLOWO2_12_FULL_45_14]|uniref:Dihydrofolate reductase n=2 Tax=Candidatus Zambryskiibacteriota TaxID=1817925 RepID=A0A1G2UML0_9BACT|nr:MAG: dihydrofolate reductase [Candidatus Zambryskibacteria bacterium RIFCSPLOWO2_02_FULL_44_12b]OHB14190.1 MAG: dihydrofolate reductase [Candidatus Zambryskibacteria bacterium RIFCSPLOWO2_12_FULL_45_14]